MQESQFEELCGLWKFLFYKQNIKLVKLVGEHSILYDWKVCGYTSKDKIDPKRENIWKELNESGKIIYC